MAEPPIPIDLQTSIQKHKNPEETNNNVSPNIQNTMKADLTDLEVDQTSEKEPKTI